MPKRCRSSVNPSQDVRQRALLSKDPFQCDRNKPATARTTCNRLLSRLRTWLHTRLRARLRATTTPSHTFRVRHLHIQCIRSNSNSKNKIYLSADDNRDDGKNPNDDDQGVTDEAADDDNDDTDGGYRSAPPSLPGAARSLTILIRVNSNTLYYLF